MSTQIITRGKLFIRFFIGAISFAATTLVTTSPAYAEWKVDFSRRQQMTRQSDLRMPASVSDVPPEVVDPTIAPNVVEAPPSRDPGFFQSLFENNDISQEIVVLNTEKGFVPSAIRVKKGSTYKIHVVNVNEQEKNVSFVLDSFSEHHATYYGKMKTFVIKPQKEGVYRFVSPETSAQGKLVVYPGGPETRMPASE